MLFQLGNYITSLFNPVVCKTALLKEPQRSSSQELKSIIEELNLHPVVGPYMRSSHSFKTAYSAAKTGMMTTYAKFLHNALVNSKSPEFAATELLMKNGDIPMRLYHEINNALSNQSRQ